MYVNGWPTLLKPAGDTALPSEMAAGMAIATDALAGPTVVAPWVPVARLV